MLNPIQIRDRVLIGASIFVITLGFVAVWNLHKNDQANKLQLERYAQNERKQREEKISRCVLLPIFQQELCYSEAYNDQLDAIRPENEIAVQQYMADVSLWQLISGWVQALMAAGGIYFIAKTYDKTAEAVAGSNAATDVMRKAMLAEHRPWIEIKNVTISYPSVSVCGINGEQREAFQCVVTYDIENTGSTPALILYRSGHGYNSDLHSHSKDELIKFYQKVESVDVTKSIGDFISPTGKSQTWFLVVSEPDAQKHLSIFIEVVVVYTNANRDQKMETRLSAMIGERQQEVSGLPNETPILLSVDGVASGKQKRIEAMHARTIVMT